MDVQCSSCRDIRILKSFETSLYWSANAFTNVMSKCDHAFAECICFHLDFLQFVVLPIHQEHKSEHLLWSAHRAHSYANKYGFVREGVYLKTNLRTTTVDACDNPCEPEMHVTWSVWLWVTYNTIEGDRCFISLVPSIHEKLTLSLPCFSVQIKHKICKNMNSLQQHCEHCH